MKKLEHIGIAVNDIDKADKIFTKLLGVAPYKRESVASEGVITSFFMVGNVKIELLAATNPESPIAKFIDKKGEGLHHLAFEVEDIHQSIMDKNKEGFQLISENAKDGADNKEIAFIHPKSAGGVLVEICSEK